MRGSIVALYIAVAFLSMGYLGILVKMSDLEDKLPQPQTYTPRDWNALLDAFE